MKKDIPRLSHVAQLLALEIKNQDWSDAHNRSDGARHDRTADRTQTPRLQPDEAATVKMNVVWVVAQALAAAEPGFNARAFAELAEVDPGYLLTRRGTPNGMIEAGIRHVDGPIMIAEYGGAWTATLPSARPDGQLAVVVAGSPQEALEVLLAG